MGSTRDTTTDDGTDTTNVIPFPKAWVAKDELIPFGPSADRVRADRAARSASTPADDGPVERLRAERAARMQDLPARLRDGGETVGADIDRELAKLGARAATDVPRADRPAPRVPALTVVTSPDDFWGGDVLHTPIELDAENESCASVLDTGPQGRQTHVPRSPAARPASGFGRRVVHRLPALHVTPSRAVLARACRPTRRQTLVGAALGVVLICVSLSVVGTLGATARNRRASTGTPSLSLSARAASSPSSSAQPRISPELAALAAQRRQLASARRQAAAGRAHAQRVAAARKARLAAVARVRHRTHSAVDAPGSSGSTARAPAYQPTSVDDGAGSSSSSSTTVPPTETEQPARSTSSSAGTSNVAALGGIVGNSCDPTCN